MTDQCAFLEPWIAVLRGALVRGSANPSEPFVQIALRTGCSPCGTFAIRLLVDEARRRDTQVLRQIREAVELLTIFSEVDNKEFKRLISMLDDTHSTSKCSIYPKWKFWLCGTITHDDPAVQAPVTYGTLIGFPDDPWTYSSNFREAAQKIRRWGEEEDNKSISRGKFAIGWICERQGAYTLGRQDLDISGDTGCDYGPVRSLLNTIVPPIVQVHLARNPAQIVEIWSRSNIPSPSCELIHISWQNFTEFASASLMTGALARTRVSQLELSFDYCDIDLDRNNNKDPLEFMMDVGLLISTLLCGRSLCKMKADLSPIICHPGFTNLRIWSSQIPDQVFVAVCSAIPGMELCERLSDLTMEATTPYRWSWLMYALWCGNSYVALSRLKLSWSMLTKDTMTVITDTLQTGYPQTVSNQNRDKRLVYGYVEVPEGIEMCPCSLNAQDTVIVSTSAYRCRACYDTTKEGVVEIIVPGYGAFTTKLDDRVLFIPDTTTPSIHIKRRDKRIDISFEAIENVQLLFDMLQWFFVDIQHLSLKISGDRNAIQHQLDLSTLATACPSLRRLKCTNFDVVLTDHNEALKIWPIQEILFERIGRVSALVSCLQNSNLRMARELVDITVMYPRESTDSENLQWLESQHGKYLPVTKKKLDARMKAAMISVVTSGHYTVASTDRKVIRYLDANILSLIFVFASTPAQRSVSLWD